MKKLLMVIICFLVVITSVVVCRAASVDINTSGLTDEQKAQLAVQIAEMQKKEIPTTERINQWVDLGKNVGVALAATAKEIGMASDQFLQSNTGKITVALIIWKVIGKDLIRSIVGIGILIAFISLWVHFFRRMCIFKAVLIEYPQDKFKKIKHFEYYTEGDCDGTRVFMFLVLVVIVLTGLLVAL